MAKGRTLKDVKAEKEAIKRRNKKRRRVLVLVIEVLILLILLGIGYLITNPGALEQMEWFQNLLGLMG